MKKIEPKFEFDDVGRGFCQYHQDYPTFVENKRRPLRLVESKRLYTCKTCHHYENDDCQFSKRQIKKMLIAIKFHIYRCEICGGNISRMFNIIYKRKIKKQKSVKIPSLCCDCVISIAQDDPLKAFKKQRKEKFYVGFSLIILSTFFSILNYSFFYNQFLFLIFLPLQLCISVFLFGGGLFFVGGSWKLSSSLKKSPIIKNIKAFSQK